MSSSQQNKQKTRKQCPTCQRQGFKTAVHKLATLKSLFSNVRIPWCPKKHAKLLSLKKYFIKSEGKTQECLVNLLTFCNVLRKSQKVLIKPTELLTLALSNASLQTLYLFKHWGQRCGVMVGGPDGFITKTSADVHIFSSWTRPPQLLWLKLMTKLLLAMLH